MPFSYTTTFHDEGDRRFSMLGGESSSLKKSFVSDLLLGMGGGGGEEMLEESEPLTVGGWVGGVVGGVWDNSIPEHHLPSLSDTSRTPLLQ